MAIGDDTAIDYTNQIIDLTGTTVYDVSVLYSYSKEQFKLSANIDDDFAWTANTPTDFTLKNGWIFRTHGIRRLKNGGIKTAYGLDEIEKLSFASGGYTNVIESDIGKVVVATGLGASDNLVDFDNTRRVWWVRTFGTAREVADSVSTTITGGTGAGTTTGTSVGSTAGTDDQWSNINTIGDLVGGNTNPYIYVFTGNLTTGDNNGNTRKNKGFEDDPDEELTNADRGVIDTLIRIKDMNVTLGNPAGNIHVYARTGLDTFSDFDIDVSAGGRIAVPISNSNDVEDTLGDYAIAVDAVTGTFTVGEEVTEDTATPLWKAEVVEVIGTVATFRILILRGLTSLPADNSAFTGTSSSATGVVRGTAGGQILTIDVETDGIIEAEYGNALSITSGSAWNGTLRGHLTIAEGTATVGYVIADSNHDIEADADYYATPLDNEVVIGTGVNVTLDLATRAVDRLCSDLDDVRVKAAFQRLTGITSGDAVRGDNITQDISSAKGTIIQVVSGTEIHVSNNNGTAFDTTNTITDDDGGSLSGTPTTAPRDETFTFAHSLQSSFNYVVMIEGSGRTNAEIYHYLKYFQQANSSSTFPSSTDQAKELYLIKEELGGGTLVSQLQQGEEYFRAFTDEDTPANSYTGQEAKSRLAVKNGSTIVTGQGVALVNVASADANNITLTDTANVQHSPFTSATVDITSTISGDHVQVALDDGAGQEDKTQVTSGVGNAAGDADIVLNASLPNDTPTGAGNDIIIKMIDDSSTSTINKEMRYRGTSFATTTVTLRTDCGTGTSTTTGSPAEQLIDSAADFGGTDTVIVGDPIRNTTDGSIAWVTAVVSTTELTTTALEGGTSNDWVSADAYEINTLVVAYIDGTDQGYIPYIDRVADATNEDEVLTFVSDRNVVIRVRNTSILDFDTTGTITSGGLSVKTVRNTDTVYSP